MENLNLKEFVKSSEHTGSGELFTGDMNEEQIAEQRKKIVELSNESVLHGFDLAIQLMEAAGQLNAVATLRANRVIIEMGLKQMNGIVGPIDGNTE